MMKRVMGSAVALGALCLAGNATAASLGMSIKSPVSGKNHPAIMIQPDESIRSISCKLKRDDGKTVTARGGATAAGKRSKLTVRQPAGSVHTYHATCTVKWATGKPTTERFKFTAMRMAKLKLKLNPNDVDMDGRSLEFSINNPGKRVDLILVGEDGKTLKKTSVSLKGKKPGTVVKLTWPKLKKKILYLEVKVHDMGGFWTGVRLTPVQTRIEGETVEFDTAKWNIRSKEEPKLKRTLAKINTAIAKFRKAGVNLQFRVYVAGYTDTVGNAGSNKTLSNNRARSIASWFRRQGLKVPCYYQGFGESVLAKKTPDETDEQANRRVLYVLATQHPSGTDFPSSSWGKL